MGPVSESERDKAAALFKEAEQLSMSLRDLAGTPERVTKALRVPEGALRVVEISWESAASAIALCYARFGVAVGTAAEALDEALTVVAEPLTRWCERGAWESPPFPDLGPVQIAPPGPEAQVGPAVHIGGASTRTRRRLLQFIELAVQSMEGLAACGVEDLSSAKASFSDRFPETAALEPWSSPAGWLGCLLRAVYQHCESLFHEFQVQVGTVTNAVSAAGAEYVRTGAWRLATAARQPSVPEEEKQGIRAILDTIPPVMEKLARELVEFGARPREGLGPDYFSLDEVDRKSTVRLVQASAQTVLWRHVRRHEALCVAAARAARHETALLVEAIERMLQTGAWESPVLAEHDFAPPEAELVPDPGPPRTAPPRRQPTRELSPRRASVTDPGPVAPQSIRFFSINKQAGEGFSGALVGMCEDRLEEFTARLAKLDARDPGLIRFGEWLKNLLSSLLSGAYALKRVVEADLDAVEGSVLHFEATRARAEKQGRGQAIWQPPALTGSEIDHFEARVLLEVDSESSNTTYSQRGKLSGFDPDRTSPGMRSAQPFIEHIVTVFDAWMSTYQANHDLVQAAVMNTRTIDDLAAPTLLATRPPEPVPLLDLETLHAECANDTRLLRHLCEFLVAQTARLVRFPDALAEIKYLEPTTASSHIISDLRAHTYRDLKHLLADLETQTHEQTQALLGGDSQ